MLLKVDAEGRTLSVNSSLRSESKLICSIDTGV